MSDREPGPQTASFEGVSGPSSPEHDRFPEPQISVIVPAHNDEAYIAGCLDSIIGQEYAPCEIIVCDDASSDGTRDVIRHYVRQHPGLIRSVFHDSNVGCAANFNSGIFAARGTHVSLVAADDYWLPHKLANEVRQLRTTGYRWCYSAVELRWERARQAPRAAPFWGTLDAASGDIFEEILLRRVSPRNILISRDIVIDADGFDEAFGMYEDWDFKLRIADRYPAAFAPVVASVYRQHDKGISRSDTDRQLSEAGKVLRKNASLIKARTGAAYEAMRDEAFLRLLPGAGGTRDTDRVAPDWLDLPYVPRSTSARGAGLMFLAAGEESLVREMLLSHPDVAVAGHEGFVAAVFTGLATTADDRARTEAGRACLSAFYRTRLVDSGRSRLLVAEGVTEANWMLLRGIFPDATFIVESASGVSVYSSVGGAVTDAGRDTAVIRRDVMIGTPGALMEVLGLPLQVLAGVGDADGLAAGDLIAEGERRFLAGDPAAAEQCFREAARNDPTSVDACNNLAVVLWHRGDVAGALNALSDGLVRDPDHRDLLRNLIRILLEIGQESEAQRFVGHYRRMYPGDPDFDGDAPVLKEVAGSRAG